VSRAAGGEPVSPPTESGPTLSGSPVDGPTGAELPVAGVEPVALFLVDDHDVVRRGLRAYADVLPDMDVVGEAASGEEAIRSIDALAEAGRRPAVVLMDLVLPGMDGVSTTAELLRHHPGMRVVVLTSFGGQQRVQAALDAGATGYLLKDADGDEGAAAVQAAVRGEIHLDSAVVGDMVGSRSGIDTLTPREREVLGLLAAGCSNQEIADRLVITERTARTHVSNLLGKLHLGSRTQAALLAQREGLTPTGGQAPAASSPSATSSSGAVSSEACAESAGVDPV
jgi:DNA-binding NarL/FixJ family response regulator